jgi:hypothetical protein
MAVDVVVVDVLRHLLGHEALVPKEGAAAGEATRLRVGEGTGTADGGGGGGRVSGSVGCSGPHQATGSQGT